MYYWRVRCEWPRRARGRVRPIWRRPPHTARERPPQLLHTRTHTRAPHTHAHTHARALRPRCHTAASLPASSPLLAMAAPAPTGFAPPKTCTLDEAKGARWRRRRRRRGSAALRRSRELTAPPHTHAHARTHTHTTPPLSRAAAPNRALARSHSDRRERRARPEQGDARRHQGAGRPGR